MQNGHHSIIGLVGLMLATAGCSSSSAIHSVKVGNDLGKSTGGPVYYLPYTVLEIEGAPCLASEAGGAKSADAKPASGTSTVITVDARPTATATSTASAAPTPAPGPKPAAGDSEKKECKKDSPTADYGLKIRSLTLADTRHAFQAAINQEGFSADQPKVTVSSAGLLSTASATSKDETREAVVAFGTALGSVVGLGGFDFANPHGFSKVYSVPVVEFGTGQTPPAKPKPSFKALCPVDGSQPISCKFVTQSDPGVAVSVTIHGPAGDVPPGALSSCDGSAGLCFRSQSQRLISIAAVSDDFPALATTTTLLPVVDVANSYPVAVPRKPMTKSVTTLAFDQGVLTSLEGDYPSTGGAVLSLPADFIGAVAGGIGDILSIRIENSQGQVELLKAQAELLEAQLALEEAREAAAEADD